MPQPQRPTASLTEIVANLDTYVSAIQCGDPKAIARVASSLNRARVCQLREHFQDVLPLFGCLSEPVKMTVIPADGSDRARERFWLHATTLAAGDAFGQVIFTWPR